MVDRINLFEPTLPSISKKLLGECVKKNEISTYSKKIINSFEKEISILSGSKHTVAVNSGSVALYLSFKSLGIKSNDLVIMPSYTFIATGTSVIYAGGKPWLFDINSNQLTIDLKQVELALKNDTYKKGKFYYYKKTHSRIFAICPVYTLGFLPDLVKIKKIARKYNLKIIADAACALGSKYNNKKLSYYNDCVCYSFNGNKSFTSGGGGAISMNNKKIWKNCSLLSTNGKIGNYFHKILGHNFKITGLHAAIGLGQLKNFKKIKTQRNKIKNNYLKFFKNNDLRTFFSQNNSDIIQWFNFYFENTKQKAFKVINFMNKNKIYLSKFWRPLHLQPCIKNAIVKNQKNTNNLWEKIIILPSSNNLSYRQMNHIKSKLKIFYKTAK